MTNSTLKAYEMDDEGTVYAAESACDAAEIYHSDFALRPWSPYPQQLTDAELDRKFPDRDENEAETGEITSIRKWLNEKTVAGFLCGGIS